MRTISLALVTLLYLVTVTSAQTVLFSDSFERTTGSGNGNGNPAGDGNGASDWGTNNNAFGGTNSATYLTTASRGGGANQVTGVNQFDANLGSHGHLLNGGVALGYSAAMDSPLGFDVAFDFDRNTDPDQNPSAGGFLAVGFGIGSASGLGGLSAVSDTELGFLFQQAANGNAANGSTIVAGDTGAPIAGFDYLDTAAAHSVIISIRPDTTGAYGTGSTINYSLSVDGSVLDSSSFVAAGGDIGLVSFSSNNFEARHVDNLVITNVVPEPSGLSLLALAILGMSFIRGRRGVVLA